MVLPSEQMRNAFTYIGLMNGEHLRLVSDFTILSLFRKYGGLKSDRKKLRIRWRFNFYGRIDEVSFDVFEKRYNGLREGAIVKVNGKRDSDLEWSESRLILYDLPEEIDYLHPTFSQFDDERKYCEVIAAGHVCAQELLHYAGINRLSGPLHPINVRKEFSLANLSKDPIVMSFLERIACLSPILEFGLPPPKARIIYESD